jgi:L-lactate dehydrogenase complex protein LldG
LSARDEIMARVRRVARRKGGEDAVAQRVERRQRGPLPAWEGPLKERFCERLEAAEGSLSRVTSRAAAVVDVVDYLDRQGLSRDLVAAPHPLLARLPWPQELRLHRRAVQDGDLAGITVAFAGIAETGSLLLLSGPETPTPLNFLVDDFICLLPAARLLPYPEDAWDLIRSEVGSLPRAVNLITGPSRTADVEQTIQLGAHGPRRLHVILIQESEG